MELNFHAFEANNIFKFVNYRIENINEKKYIVPNSVSKEHDSGAPLIDLEEDYSETILIEFLNIGKSAVFKEDNLEKQVIEFVNKYSTLGLMCDFPINRYFFLDEKIILKDYNYVGNSDFTTIINRKEYFKLFFPTCNDKQIDKIINDVIKLTEEPAMEKYITSDMNRLLIGSNWYCEPLDMFVQYATYLYNLLNYISMEDTFNINDLLKQFEVNNVKISLLQTETLSIEFQINCLKQYLDYYFAKSVAKDINLLKICKFCNKAFLANNPKAEYDTPQCKNKANVYKSRSKNK